MTIPKMRHGLFTSPGMQSVYSTPYMNLPSRDRREAVSVTL